MKSIGNKQTRKETSGWRVKKNINKLKTNKKRAKSGSRRVPQKRALFTYSTVTYLPIQVSRHLHVYSVD